MDSRAHSSARQVGLYKKKNWNNDDFVLLTTVLPKLIARFRSSSCLGIIEDFFKNMSAFVSTQQNCTSLETGITE